MQASRHAYHKQDARLCGEKDPGWEEIDVER
jgi:hypothetical protein